MYSCCFSRDTKVNQRFDATLNARHDVTPANLHVSLSAMPRNGGAYETLDDRPSDARGINMLFFRRFLRLLRIGFPLRSQETLFLVLMWRFQIGFVKEALFVPRMTFYQVITALGWQVLVYYMGLTISEFYSLIISRNEGAFFSFMVTRTVLIAGICFVIALLKFLEGLVALHWRRKLCYYLHERYLSSRNYYKMAKLDDRIDNPDQRMTADADLLTQKFRQICTDLVTAPFIILYYTYITWSLIGWMGPTAVYVYFVVGSIVSRYMMGPLVGMVAEHEKREGNFRHSHFRLRQFSECVAFYKGEQHEKGLIDGNVDSLYEIIRRILIRQFPLDYVVVAIPVFAGMFDYIYDKDDGAAKMAQLISLSGFACMMLISGFSSLLSLSQSLADLAGYTTRVAEMLEVVSEIEATPIVTIVRNDEPLALAGVLDEESPPSRSVVEGFNAIVFESVTLESPKGGLLIRGLTFALEARRGLLVMGPSGSGKSSLLRALSELWPLKSGVISRPSAELKNMLFLPQVPYVMPGTLREQLLYPQASSLHVDESTLFEILDIVKLHHIYEYAGGWDCPIPWPEILSPGEQQRVSIARLLLICPQFAILDESTSAIDVDLEARIYRVLRQKGIGLISVGHRPSLKAFHDMLLQLSADGTGSYTLTMIEQSSAS